MAGKPQPIIVLVEPQLPENIGMCARAMLNCGLERLRLVRPREGWPNDRARAAAADADPVLDGAELFDSVAGAVADCRHVFATTARDRSLNLPVLPVGEAVADLPSLPGSDGEVAILFGAEASGLDNEALSRADKLVRFPTNPEFPSLNLAQAVLLFGWEWRRVSESGADTGSREHLPADRRSLENFVRRLFSLLEEGDFFLTPELRPHSERTLRGLVTRMAATEEELQFLHGVVTALGRAGSHGENGD